MEKEVKKAIRTTEDIGEDVFTIAMVLPNVLGSSIELGKDLVVIPLSAIKSATIFAAGKVDDTVGIVV